MTQHITEPLKKEFYNLRLLVETMPSRKSLILIITNPNDTEDLDTSLDVFNYEDLESDLDSLKLKEHINNMLSLENLPNLNDKEIQELKDNLQHKIDNNIIAFNNDDSLEGALFKICLAKARYLRPKRESLKIEAINSYTPLTKITDFLKTDYEEETNAVLYGDSKDLVIDYNKFEMMDFKLADKLIDNPEKIINLFNEALEILNTSNKRLTVNIRFKGINITPLKNVLADKIGTLVETKGVVKGLGEVKARVETAVYECQGCLSLVTVNQSKGAGVMAAPTICSECQGRSFNFLPELSTYYDVRDLLLEETTYDLSTRTPRRMLVELEDNLIYNVDTGNRVNLTGTVATYKKEKDTDNKFKILANYIENSEDNSIIVTPEDRKITKKLSEDVDIIELLIDSLAPELILPSEFKLAILCYLVKGIYVKNEREMIHVLFITDPSTAKSQLAKRTIELAEKGIETDGTNTTGAGLTAAVIRDIITNEWIVEAGAMPLANNGHLVIDEFDKLPTEETKKLLKGMEQGIIEINKAGLNETLEANTSLLALANPKYGRFDKYKTIKEQTSVYAPIMSRFDLTFILMDIPENKKDLTIVNTILSKYRKDSEVDIDNNILPADMLRKYIKIASELNPMLNKEADDLISSFYVNTRNTEEEDDDLLFIDTRSINSIIRLAGAIAKLKLKEEIGVEETKVAIELKKASLRSAGLNPITNKIDIDSVQGNLDNSDRKKRDMLIYPIKEWLEDNQHLEIGYIPKSTLRELAEEEGIGKNAFYNTFKQLKTAGDVEEINKNVYLRI